MSAADFLKKRRELDSKLNETVESLESKSEKIIDDYDEIKKDLEKRK